MIQPSYSYYGEAVGRWSALYNEPKVFGNLAPGYEIDLWFQIELTPLMLDGGSFHQEVTINSIC